MCRYSPPKIDKMELDLLPIKNESDLHDIPDWLWPKWKATLGRKANDVANTLKERANIFLRVNISKVTRKVAIQALELVGHHQVVGDNILAPLRVPLSRPPILHVGIEVVRL